MHNNNISCSLAMHNQRKNKYYKKNIIKKNNKKEHDFSH